MKIEEKAKEFAGYDNPSLQGIVTTTARMIGKYDGFKAGANWMLEKACEYIKNQYPVHYQEWAELADEYVEQFKKAMEE